ncbi:MAG: TonB-dependent receptor, partial [Flavobacteriales bacterium]|nr:TonB-dependent receptor [Flavobacteriales bacterium]
SSVGGSTAPITTVYEKNKKVADYVGFEPRLNARYEINKASSFKFALSRNLQFITLTSLSPSSLPTDVWLPSTDRLKPQLASQASIGYFRNFFDDSWESSVELYYKDMRNLGFKTFGHVIN